MSSAEVREESRGLVRERYVGVSAWTQNADGGEQRKSSIGVPSLGQHQHGKPNQPRYGE
jgi:hypothetical protein